MPTRLKKPSVLKQLFLTVLLSSFLVYLGFSAIGGQFGIDSQKQMVADIEILGADKASLQAEIDSLQHRISLFDPKRLDPDILTERGRALLSMTHPDDIILTERPVRDN